MRYTSRAIGMNIYLAKAEVVRIIGYLDYLTGAIFKENKLLRISSNFCLK